MKAPVVPTLVVASIMFTVRSAIAATPTLVCPHAVGTVPFLPPEDRPTTADCYFDTAGVHVPLNSPAIRVNVPAGSSLLTVSTRGHLIEITDSRGTHIPVGLERLVNVDDPSGDHIGVVYDAAARVAQVSAPEGIVTFTYSGDLLIAVNAPVAGLRAFAYDAAGEPVDIVDADGPHLLTYDVAGRIVQVSGAAVARNAAGAITSAAGTSFTYDAGGRLTSSTGGGSETAFTYDVANSLTSVTAAGATWTYTRSALGLALAVSDGSQTWTFTYDAAQRLTASTPPGGQPTQRTYDARGDLTAITDPGGGVTRFTRTANRRLIRIAYADATLALFTYSLPAVQTVCPHAVLGPFSAPEDDAPATDDCYIAVVGGIRVYLNGSFSVDGPLNPVIAAFRVTSIGTFRDVANGRGDSAQVMGGDVPASIVAPTGLAATFTRTASNLSASVTDAVGATTSYNYAANGTMTALSDALGATMSFGSSAGRVVAISDPDNHLVASFTYDAAGRLVSATDGSGSQTRFVWSVAGLVSSIDPVGLVTDYLYDGAGHLLSTKSPFGVTVLYVYDGAGNLTSVVDEAGRTWAYLHDAFGHLTRYTDPLGHAVLFAYSSDGILTTRTDQLSQTTTYTHNAAGDFLSTTNPLGATTRFAYNANRSTTAILDPLNRSTRFVYDFTPPVITVPAPITVDATSPAGATVTYAVTVTDPDDVSVLLTCTPVSGATFAIGVTTVSCEASDPGGNVSTASFTITVRGASTQIDNLISAVNGLILSKGLTTALNAKLAAAQSALALGDAVTACSAVADFIAQVHAKIGKDISQAQADVLIGAALQIRSVIGC